MKIPLWQARETALRTFAAIRRREPAADHGAEQALQAEMLEDKARRDHH
jgi:hypothetical protein